MNKIFTLILALFFVGAGTKETFGQCNDCPENKLFKADYCFTDTKFPDLCAQFKENQNNFVLLNKKKEKLIPETTSDSLGYYLGLVREKSLKLAADELLFIQEAIKVWKKEKRDIGLTYRESGLGYKVTKLGDGDSVSSGQRVIVHYTGLLEDGKKFDSSLDRSQPFTFTLGAGQVIKGWDEGISLLTIGSKALLKIPSNLAYGPRGAGGVIPPNATLYFEVELIGVE